MTDNQLYVILKLVSGEDVMAVLSSEDNNCIYLTSPICIRTHPIFQAGREQVTAVPLCQFSEENFYIIHKRNVMFIKKLHHAFIPHYQRIVEEQGKSVRFHADKEKEPTEKKDIINKILREDTEEIEEELPSYFIEGNDTIN
jgi:hypothetical protein